MDSSPLVSRFDVLLLDLDGVLFVGSEPVAHAAEAIAACREHFSIGTQFITNNASRTAQSVADQLADLGVPAQPTEVVTSAQVAAAHLAAELPAGSRVLVVGGEGLTRAIEAAGLVPVSEFNDGPLAVVQGFHPDVNWRSLAQGAIAVSSGVPWVATNTDMTLPTAQGLAPGNGALVRTIEIATGRSPLSVGKPQSPIIREAVSRSGAQRPLIVGDRLDTDIAAANATGLPSLLVLTGVSTVIDLCQAPPAHRPTYVGADLRVLLGPVPIPVVVDGNNATCQDWRVRCEGGELTILSRGKSAMQGVRCIGELCWSMADQDRELPTNARELLSDVAPKRSRVPRTQ